MCFCKLFGTAFAVLFVCFLQHGSMILPCFVAKSCYFNFAFTKMGKWSLG